MFKLYELLAIIVIITLLTVGSWFAGYTKGKDSAKLIIDAYKITANQQIADLQKQTAVINTKVVTQYVDRVKTITKEKKVYVHDAQSFVPSLNFMSIGWVYLHDSSATSVYADTTRSADATSSTIKDNIALATIVSNYGICNQNAEQLKALQEWIVRNKELIEKNNKK